MHFDEALLAALDQRGVERASVTLHVGAGTFKPVKAACMQDHEMHAEYIDVDDKTIRDIKAGIGKIAAVGTTSLRTLESLYWLGVKALLNPGEKKLTIHQWDVYNEPFCATGIKPVEALEALIEWMQQQNTTHIFTQTQLLIAPGYKFRLANILITN